MTGIILAVLFVILFLMILRVVYSIAFGVKSVHENVDLNIPRYAQYEELRSNIEREVKSLLSELCEKVSIHSRDGLKLTGRYYQMDPKAPVVILFHGYRGSAVKDSVGGFNVSKSMGYNILIVDERSHGDSEGRTITMGIKERYDCLDWIHYVTERFGQEKKIMIMGLSMGAATVLMASELDLPENVKGIVADCGYSNVKEMVIRVAGFMHFPAKIIYPFARLSARIYGGFDPDETSPASALRNCKIPVLLIHGEADELVPVEMSWENYHACGSEKEILIVPKANH